MSSITKKYQELVEVLEKNIKDQKELELAKRKLIDLSLYYADTLNSLVEMQENMEKVNRNVRRLQNRVESIEDDIYLNMEDDDEFEALGSDQMHDNEFEFEITCPYCDYEFITDNSYKNEKEIKCPKCRKTIELDWDDTEPCNGDCRACEEHCFFDEEDEEEGEVVAVSEDEEEYEAEGEGKEINLEDEKKKDDNDDDM